MYRWQLSTQRQSLGIICCCECPVCCVSSSHGSRMQEGESAESWQSILQGLSDLCAGLGPKLAEHADEDNSLDVFDDADLCALYQKAQSAGARTAVLSIATAFPESTAVAALRARSAVHLSSSTDTTKGSTETLD